MPSIIKGFEYDIFISYRQKDNKGDHWVTEFVHSLKEELEATFKEDINLYFDANAYDGLQDHDDVNDSLREKLKCLVFIPILSRTYCDPNSFAWKHELSAFVRLASEDRFGLKVKSAHGNVASRILPVRIHDLEKEDVLLFEEVTGSAARPIDFVYKSAGVNRPLRLNEVHPDDNIYHTLYHDQVNKVANAVRDIVKGLLNLDSGFVGHEASLASGFTEKHHGLRFFNQRIIQVITGFLILFLFGFLYFLMNRADKETENSIAVLPFRNLSNDPQQEYFSDGMTRQINTNLGRLKELKVIGTTSVMHYKGTSKTIPQIAKELNNVSYVLDGSVQKSGNKIKVDAHLIRCSDGYETWVEDYDRDLTDIFLLQDDLSEKIAQALLGELLPDQKSVIKTDHPVNIEAYEYYLKGLHLHVDRFASSYKPEDFRQAEKMFLKAISIDPRYARAYAALGDLYDTNSLRQLSDSVVRIGYRINPNDPYVRLVRGFIPFYLVPPDLDSTFYYLKAAQDINGNDPIINREIGWIMSGIGLEESAEKILRRALQVDPLNARSGYLLSLAQYWSGNINGAKETLQKVLETDRDNLRVNFVSAAILLFHDHDLQGTRERYASMMRVNPDNTFTRTVGSWLLAMEGKKKESLAMPINIGTYSILNMKAEAISLLDSLSKQAWQGYSYPRLVNDSRIDFIRNEPEFQKIIAREKKYYEERQAKYGTLFE